MYSTLVSTAILANHIDDSRFVVVDCRHDLADVDAGARAYRAGHLPGALFMHLDRDLSGRKTGRNGADVRLKVPVGTIALDGDGGLIADLDRVAATAVVAKGGIGGRGIDGARRRSVLHGKTG